MQTGLFYLENISVHQISEYINHVEQNVEYLINLPSPPFPFPPLERAWNDNLSNYWLEIIRTTIELHSFLYPHIEDHVMRQFRHENFHLYALSRYHRRGIILENMTITFFNTTLPQILTDLQELRFSRSNHNAIYLFAMDVFYRLVSALITLSRHVMAY